MVVTRSQLNLQLHILRCQSMADTAPRGFSDEFEAERAAVEEEQQRVGLSHADLAPLFDDDIADELRVQVDAGQRILVGPISFQDQLAVLQSLSDGAGPEAFRTAFRAYRVRQAASRARDV